MPADLLIAAACKSEPREPWVDLCPPSLSHLLHTKGMAETHLHGGAATSFPLLWIRAMGTVNPIDMGNARKLGEREMPFKSVQVFERALKCASLLRLLLAWKLRSRSQGSASLTVSDCIESFVRALQPSELGHWVRELGRVVAGLYRPGVGARALPTPSPRLASGLLHATGAKAGKVRDGVARILNASSDVHGEMALAHRFLKYGPSFDEGTGDSDWMTLFWQYQRIRVMTHRWLVQDPGTAGLGWFVQHYGRIDVFPENGAELEEAVELESAGGDLRALELRKAPRANDEKYRKLIVEGAKLAGAREVAFVLHWIKATAKLLPSANLSTACRYGSWYKEQEQLCRVFEKALKRRPWLLLFVRGFDVANLELRLPNWAIAPLYKQVRESAARHSAFVVAAAPGLLRQPLRMTAHAGEDYRCLQEGIRRVGELFDPGQILEHGDRIGHALAIGEDPVPWASGEKLLLQPAEERLHDLLWELDLRERGELHGAVGGPSNQHSGARIHHLRRSARELGTSLDWPLLFNGHGESGDNFVDQMLELRRLLFNPSALARLGYPRCREQEPCCGPLLALYRYLRDENIARAGQTPVDVPTGPMELSALQELQAWVRRKMAAMEITVESNPSSNLLVGDLGCLEQHPTWRMRQDLGDIPGVQVSVNDDDPIIFATRLADEYAYLYAELVASGKSPQEALRWIDDAREAGMRSRFTLDLKGREVLLDELSKMWPEVSRPNLSKH